MTSRKHRPVLGCRVENRPVPLKDLDDATGEWDRLAFPCLAEDDGNPPFEIDVFQSEVVSMLVARVGEQLCSTGTLEGKYRHKGSIPKSPLMVVRRLVERSVCPFAHEVEQRLPGFSRPELSVVVPVMLRKASFTRVGGAGLDSLRASSTHQSRNVRTIVKYGRLRGLTPPKKVIIAVDALAEVRAYRRQSMTSKSSRVVTPR